MKERADTLLFDIAVMKLLICTQAVDKEDPILGFFHGWIKELAKHFESIHVICLKEGIHTLPENVRVYSLGKESGENRLKYILRFYSYVWKLRGTYTRIFIHMNPHYILLSGLYWKLSRIPIFFWRNHAQMNLMTRIAAMLSKRVMFTSPFACMSVYAHGIQMPVGIDTKLFNADGERTSRDTHTKRILFLGRLSPVKRAEIYVEAARYLQHGYEFHLYGNDPLREQKYFETLKKMSGTNVFFHPAIKNNETPDIYRAFDVYVNLTPEGSMDKTVLEAASCGVSILVSNTSFSNILHPSSLVPTVSGEELAQKISAMANLSQENKKKYSMYAQENITARHSLEKLATALYSYMK